MKRNFRIICCILILITSLILYKTVIKLDRNDSWSSMKTMTYYVTPNFTLPESFCSKPSTILIMVHSHPSNWAYRTTIRRTWKQEATNLYFVLGESETLEREISEEKRRHRDIIQASFIDSGDTLTLKSVLTLQLANFCDSTSLYLLKTDDHSLVNVPKLEEMLFERNFPKYLLMGELHCGPESMRYLSGGAYLMSIAVAQKLYQEALGVPLMSNENEFVTGFCALKGGIRLEHGSFFSTKYVLKKGCLLKDAYAVLDLTLDEMRKYYAVMRSYSRVVCLKAPIFSARKWFFDWVFIVRDTPFSYRKTCS